MTAEPQAQHQWLQQLVGEWIWEMPAEKMKGTESVSGLGRLWVVLNGRGQMSDGKPSATQMTLGYDPEQNAFVGSWCGSMMTHMWIYQGSLDATQKVLTLETEGPSFKGDGKTVQYRDMITLKSADERELKSHAQQEDGSWKPFMTVTYKRVQ